MSFESRSALSSLHPRRRGRHRARPGRRFTPFRLAALALLLTAQVGYIATTSFADGGDFTLDFVAAAPGTYSTVTGMGGEYDDRIIGDNVVESLEGGDFACGDVVEFFTAVTVDSGATGTQTIDINYDFSAVTTSGGQVGFGDIVYVQVNPGDSGNLNLEGDETATLIDETHTATDTLGTVEVTNLDAGDQVIVALGVQITCEVTPGTVTGNIQSAIVSAETSEGDAIPVGQQVVPLKSAGEIAAPGISVAKTCTPTVHVGDDITYEITITNTGNETLNITSVTDTVLGDITSSFPATLGAGLSDTETFTHTADLGDGTSLTNTVTANATGAISGTATSGTASCTTTIEFTSDILVEKSCTPEVPVGGTVTYTITVTNTGEDVLDNITVIDSLLGDLSDSFADSLDPGDSESHDFTRDQQPGDPDPIENTVTAEADGAFSGAHVSSTATCLSDVTHEANILVEKSCDLSAPVDGTIDYTITVTNTGNDVLEDITVVDSVLGDLSDSFADTLDPGESESHDFTHDVSPSDEDPLTNTVVASAVGVDSDTSVDSTAECTTDITHEPGIAVEKTCPKTAAVGDTITYEITVTNTGNEPLTNVTVIDSVVGDISDLFSDTLDVGASETVEVTHEVTASDPNPLENHVTATGTGADSLVDAEAGVVCSTAIPPVIALTGANTGQGMVILLLLLMTGAVFLFLGRRPEFALASGAHRRTPRGAHAADTASQWTSVTVYRGSHRRRSRLAWLRRAEHGT